jgi:ferredoxin--NADP+ reductase
VIQGWTDRAAAGHTRRLSVRFWLRPVAIEGTECVSGLTVERTRLDQGGTLTGTGELETLPVQMVLRSVGYQSVPLAGVPFDKRTATVPNADGRVLGPDGAALPGEYVAGWLKRGPTGVIGTNKSDAASSVRSLLSDLAGAGAPERSGAPRHGIAELLATRGVLPVSYSDWLRVEQAEAALGSELGRGARVKLPGRQALERICRPPAR